MKVYVITSGEYSSYHIDAVFTDEDTAYKYASLDADRSVEEYETDTATVDGELKMYYQCCYNLARNHVWLKNTVRAKGKDRIVHENSKTSLFYFYLDNSVENYKAIDKSRYRGNSRLLLKIAADRLAAYAYSVGKSVSEIQHDAQERERKYEEKKQREYMMIMNERLREAEIHYRIKNALQEMTDAGLPLPGPDELNALAERIREDVMKEEQKL